MIQVFADGVLAYDSRLEDYDLEGLKITNGQNVGGTAEIVMAPDHPAYNLFISHRTIVDIYRDGKRRWRGRSLYPADNYYGERTITCEGELCLLRDGVSRPYLYQATPAEVFTSVITDYNAQVEPFKQFTIGTITVVDDNDYIRLESESAEQTLDTINKLLERCGGYITFTDNEDGTRAINWLADINRQSTQVIEFGDNLLDFTSTGANTTSLATGLVPYGSKNEETGLRVTIESVNGGKDFIVDETARAVRGTIMTPVTWDDVTEPANLLKKARAYLATCKLFITSLELTALDLSVLDKTLDSFEVGDNIRVVSTPHGVDEFFQLTQKTEDLLNPADSKVTLGKDIQSLTGADVAGDNRGGKEIEAIKVQLSTINVPQIKEAVTAEVRVQMQSVIEQTEQSITLQVSQTYATKTALSTLQKDLVAKIDAKAGNITMEVSGGLGGKASINLTVDGTTQTKELDLSAIRKAFADDKSAVVISGGTVTFNSGTLIVNSANLQVSADGTLTAKNVELSGNLTTTSGDYSSKLTSGKLRFNYDGVELGSFASTRYSEDNSKRGVAIHLETDTDFISFSRYSADDGVYNASYIINYGMNPSGLTERHLFYGDLRLIGGNAHFQNVTYFESNAVFANTRGVRFYNKAGADSIMSLYMSATDQLVLGNVNYPTYVQGSAVHVGQTDVVTTLYGSEITFNGSAHFTTAAYFDRNVLFANSYGIRSRNAASEAVTLLYMTTADEIRLGNTDYKLTIYGNGIYMNNPVYCKSPVYFQQSVVFDNVYGVRLYKKDASAHVMVLNMSDTDYVRFGNADYQTRLYGSTVHVYGATTFHNAVTCTGSITLGNGYGVQIKNTAGTATYVLSLSTSNQCMVGTAEYATYLRGTSVCLYASGATVTSDRRKKNSIEELPEAYLAALDKLTPKRFKFNDGTSGRYHVGFIAQEVEEALAAVGLTTQDFGGFVDLNGDGTELGLIYTEFIGLLLQKMRRLENKINELEGAKL